ncbi:MAG: phosphomannomutase/phosphoglucomutase [Gammaproteobacteria bacterium]|nr:phosphomannomutase/phosphoglucomutase [Gammaproteobacteria bacterium]
MKVLKTIFKAYDIRGIYKKELTLESIDLIARSLSDLYQKDNDIIVVGRDGRLSSEAISNTLIRGLLESGKKVIDIGQVPTPLLYFAVNYFKVNSGIIVTGSHNPKNYNGLKIIMDNHALAGEEIQNIYNKILSKNLKKINKNSEVGEEKINIEKNYLEAILKDIKINKKLKVAIDAGNGAAGPISLKIYKKLGLEVIDLYCDIDGNFPNHHPNPSEPKNLINLISSVKENKCDIGVAFDGDGDRCLIIDNLGNILWPDRQMMLYSKNILSKNANEKIVFDVKSSKDLPIYIKEYGGIAVMSRTGHSYIKMKMKEINAILGGEMSGHIFFKDRWFGFDDGIYASLRMLEIISNENKKSSEIFDELPSSYSTPEINIKVDKDGNQHEFMKKFCSKVNFDGAEISKIDGLRADFKNGWGLVRASNTTPCLVMRFEANTEEELKEIQDKFTSEILNIDSTLEIPNGKK